MYTLKCGIHQYTLTSRDYCPPVECETRAEALAELEKKRAWFSQLGYVIWFAELWSDDEHYELLEQTPYH